MVRLDPVKERRAVHVGHAQVADHRVVVVGMRRDQRLRLRALPVAISRAVARSRKRLGKQYGDLGLVVDDDGAAGNGRRHRQDDRAVRRRRDPRSPAPTPFSGARGSVSSNAAPPSRDDFSVSRPPCASARPREIDSPMPVPTPCGFVVKNGSKICAAMASGMPGPLSATTIRSVPSRRRAQSRGSRRRGCP